MQLFERYHFGITVGDRSSNVWSVIRLLLFRYSIFNIHLSLACSLRSQARSTWHFFWHFRHFGYFMAFFEKYENKALQILAPLEIITILTNILLLSMDVILQ